MRQFVLAGNVAYGGASVDAVAAGAVAMFYLNKDGVDTLVSTGKENFGRCNLVVGRGMEVGGPIVLPMFRYHMSYVRSDYKAGTKFHAEVTIPTDRMIPFCNYTVIVVKNGIQFNERNKWTATIAGGARPSAATIASSLARHLQNNKIGHGLTVTVADAKLTFDGNDYRDYTILLADALTGVDVTMVHAEKPINDACMIQDYHAKAWADMGFQNTEIEPNVLMYPKLHLGGWTDIDPQNKGFTVFTIRFAEPREMKTRDEVVHQIIQVAFPTGATGIATFETVLKGMTDEGGLSGQNLC